MLTSDEVEKIALDFFLGRSPRIKGKEADELRKALAKDKEFAERMGWHIELPFEAK